MVETVSDSPEGNILPYPEDDSTNLEADGDVGTPEDGKSGALKDGISSAPEDGVGNIADEGVAENREDHRGNDYMPPALMPGGACGIIACPSPIPIVELIDPL